MSKMTEKSRLFAPVDAAWLHMDTPGNLAIITGVISFKGSLDFERLQRTVETRLLTYERFRMRVREPVVPLLLPSWELDPDFDLANHLVKDSLPYPGDHALLQELVSRSMSLPMDSRRPLWKIMYLDQYNGGSALVCRLHHCIADGIALMQILLSLADESPDEQWADVKPSQPDYVQSQGISGIKDSVERANQRVHEGVETLTDPSRLASAIRLGYQGSRALGKLLFIPPDPKTKFKQRCDVPKRCAWTKAIRVEDVKAVGQKMGGTINDILISAMTGALRRYLEENGEVVEGLNFRAVVPVNLRPSGQLGDLGNRFGLVFLSLPIGIRDPLQRLLVLRQRMNAIKDSPEAVVALGILGAIGVTPKPVEDIVVKVFGVKGTAVMTNVPGPRAPLFLAGQQIDSFMFWVPTPGNISLGISILSYNGDVILGVATDEGMVADPDQIIASFLDEFEYLKAWGKLKPETPESKSDEAKPAEFCQAMTKKGQPCRNRALPGKKTCRVHDETA
jgi:WS/DGAT/MGAT family acyltransferase